MNDFMLPILIGVFLLSLVFVTLYVATHATTDLAPLDEGDED